jgi:hypothetical protein
MLMTFVPLTTRSHGRAGSSITRSGGSRRRIGEHVHHMRQTIRVAIARRWFGGHVLDFFARLFHSPDDFWRDDLDVDDPLAG